VIVHWDEVDSGRRETGHLGGELRGLGLIGRLEDVEYGDGEPRS
jgi:hypothetical protein